MDSPFKALTATLSLLTAIVVLFGTVTDQGWLPSFVKGPAQSVLPGQQPGESGGGGGDSGGTGGGGTATNSSSSSTVPGDTCIQGYVWREAIRDDHVCVTPQMRDRVQEDNQLADSRRIG